MISTLCKSSSLLNEQSDKFQKEAGDKEKEEKEKKNVANKFKWLTFCG